METTTEKFPVIYQIDIFYSLEPDYLAMIFSLNHREELKINVENKYITLLIMEARFISNFSESISKKHIKKFLRVG